MGNTAGTEDDEGGSSSSSRDSAKHEVRLACTEILRVAGMRGFHTSVIVDDLEFFFDREGIMAAPPLWSHTGRVIVQQQLPVADGLTEILEVGRSHCSGRELVRILSPFFERGTYDIFHKNCNSFTDVALYLLVRQRLDGRFNRIERLVAATSPLSTDLLNRLVRAFCETSTGVAVNYDVHVTNPRAQGFSVKNVIASLDDDSEAEQEAKLSDEGEDSDDSESSDRSADGGSCGDRSGGGKLLRCL